MLHAVVNHSYIIIVITNGAGGKTRWYVLVLNSIEKETHFFVNVRRYCYKTSTSVPRTTVDVGGCIAGGSVAQEVIMTVTPFSQSGPARRKPRRRFQQLAP